MPDHSASHASALSLVSNVALAGVKLLVGFVGNSYALIADGIESLADTISSVVVWSGLRVGSRQPDHDHPYGHGKAEAIATFIAGIGLMISGGLIAYQSIGGIISSEKQTPEFFTLPVLALIIIIKELLYRFMNRQAHKHDSQALLQKLITIGQTQSPHYLYWLGSALHSLPEKGLNRQMIMLHCS